MNPHRDLDPYGWLNDRPAPTWRRIDWWRVSALVLATAVVLFTVVQCTATFMGGWNG